MAIGALLDLLPLWLPIRVVLVVLGAGPVVRDHLSCRKREDVQYSKDVRIAV